MASNTKRILSTFILFPSILKARMNANDALIEQCGWLCSVKDFQSVKAITGLIDTPAARLYETIAANSYRNPDAFIIENIDDKYRGRVILSVAIAYKLRGDLTISTQLLAETSKLTKRYNDAVTQYLMQKELAIIYSIAGDHEAALNIIKATFPLARYLYKKRPAYYFDFLNSLAVELGEVGRLEEAQRLIGIALASPYAFAYPEWFETQTELNEKGRRASRSIIAVTSEFAEAEEASQSVEVENVFRLNDWPRENVIDRSSDVAVESGKKILDWKMDVVKKNKSEPEKDPDSQEFGRLPRPEKVNQMAREILKDELEDDELIELMEKYKRIKSKRVREENK